MKRTIQKRIKQCHETKVACYIIQQTKSREVTKYPPKGISQARWNGMILRYQTDIKYGWCYL